jgi:PAS domain S-box-containing protein
MTRWFEISTVRARSALWLAVLLIPALLVALWIQVEWRRHERDDTSAEAVRLAGHAAALHARLIHGSQEWLDGLSSTLEAVSPDEALVRRILVGRLEAESRYINVGIIDPHGAIVLSGRPAGQIDVSQQPHYRRAIETRAFAVGAHHTDYATGRSTLTVATPILDGAGRISHLLFAVVDVAWMREFPLEARIPAGTGVALVDRHGGIVLQAPEPAHWIGRRIPETLRARLDIASDNAVEAASEDGVERLYGLTAVNASSGGDFYVAIGIPKAVATVKAERLLLLTFAAFGLAGFMTVTMAVAGAELHFLRPLTTIVTTAKRLSQGDLSARTGLPRRGDELNQLAMSVDEMAAALQQREREVREQHDALLRQERRYHALVENSSDAVVLVGDDERVLYASPSTSRIIGCRTDELVGHNAFERVHPDDRACLREAFTEVVQEPAGSRLANYRVKHADGSWRSVEAVATNMLDEPSVRAVVANYRDITDRRRAEDELRRAHEQLEVRVQERTAALVSANAALQKLSLAIEQTADCVVISDANGTIEYVNPAFEALTGYSRSEAVGRSANLVKSGRHGDAFYAAVWKKITAGEVCSCVFINRKKDGQIYYEDKAISPIHDGDGRITHFVSTGRDITHRKRTEEALRRLNEQLEHEAKRIASALHDEAGRFLMTAHITLADVARDLPPETGARLRLVRRDLDQVEEQLRRLSHELRPRILDDLGLREALTFLADGVSRRTGIAISVQASLEARYPPLVETALYRMVQEALLNIGRHAQARQATVVLEEEDQRILCSIRDDGHGFDVSGLARAGAGGLGLVGIQDRLEAVGGTLEIVSSPGGGTELRTAVPLEA